MLRLTIVLLVVVSGQVIGSAQTHSKTYPETRRLLLKMERAHDDKILKKLFEEGEARKTDLLQALYDPEQKVSLNAQSIIKYLADPQGLSALEEWYAFRRKNDENYWISPVAVLPEVRYLDGKNQDLAKLVLEALHPNEKDVWAKLVAFNKGSKTALIEIVYGDIFTEGWHVVIRKENGRWRLLSNYLVWQS
ncbi:MAG TPA: hypothetical protein VIG25_09300 [Pyrinomonadaceae bacterium]